MSSFEDAMSVLSRGNYLSLDTVHIMIKDEPIIQCRIGGTSEVVVQDIFQLKDCFINKTNISRILNNRFTIFNRYGVTDYLKSIGLSSKVDILKLTKGVSLTDCLWVKFDSDSFVKWEHINPYVLKHKFDVNWLIDKGNPLFGKVYPNYSTNGSFPKCWDSDAQEHYLIKCGSSGAYNAGLEPLSEILFTQIASALDYENVVHYFPYEVTYDNLYKYNKPGLLNKVYPVMNGRLASICADFTDEETSLISAADLGFTSYEEVLDFAERVCHNWQEIPLMFLCDCIGLNIDRHMGNIGFTYNSDTLRIDSVAPMYDNNLALIPYWEDRVELDSYVKEQRAWDGKTFIELGKWLLLRYPKLRNKLLNCRDISLELQGMSKERLDILSGICNNMIVNLLEG